jgi:hypothetical protein
VIGRSALADIRLESRRCSSEHATVTWFAGRWILRDLGSSNGTKLNGRSLFPGDRTTIAPGSRLQFGDDEEVWSVVDDERPAACAVRLGPQEYCWGAPSLLVLPNEEHPEASVYANPEGWWVDSGSELRSVESGDIVALESGYWRLLLPEHAARSKPSTAGPELDLMEISLSFSPQPSSFSATIHHGATSIDLPARSCLKTLLVLARLRLESAASEAEAGWIASMDLAEMLRCSLEKVNVDVHRLRKLFQDAGVRNAAQIVERDDLKRLRIAISRLRHTS